VKYRKPKQAKYKSKEKQEVKKSLSTSGSGSSINSQKNKSDLDHLKKNIVEDKDKKGFLIKMSIDDKNLRK